MPTFIGFVLLPVEIQDLVWFHAANYGPSIQFFHGREPQDVMSLYSDMDLIPDHQAAVRNLHNLSLVCKAAYTAVLKSIRALDNPTIMRHSRHRPRPTVSLRLDLRSDIVCSKSLGIPFEWAEYSHIVFTSTRRFGVRCAAKWAAGDLRIALCDHRDDWIPNYRVRACSRCLKLGAILLGKFQRLECLYLIVDNPPMEDQPGGSIPLVERAAVLLGTPEMFHAYRDAYYQFSASPLGCGKAQPVIPPLPPTIEDELVSAKDNQG
ncbi:hypothetical protein GQ53DRAFT_816353 [Thozetella sp. PMI_491]|nr:hypothetical protein GQ53DRAFT_816353 [Thozetella sp. PMI_491]